MKNKRNRKCAAPFAIRTLILTVGVALTVVMTGQPQVGLAQSPQPGAVRGASLSRLGALVVQRQPGATDTTYLNKLDTQTQDLVSDFLSTSDAIGAGRAHNARVSADGRVLIDIYVKGNLNAGTSVLRSAGLGISATDTLFNRVTGYLPITNITDVARFAEVKAVMTVRGFGTDAGSVTSQGDAAHNGPAARALGYNGSGVKVGVISDSMDQVGLYLAGSQSSFDLPASVAVLSDDVNGIDEGRAMAEIIYDTAPGITQMYFGSGTASGAPGKATAIDDLVNAGVSIIADDIYYLSEPFFQDGPVAQAVDRARAKGVLYFASAGNRARQSYESSFITSTGGYHDFNTTAAVDNFQTVATVNPGYYIQLFLQWDDPWGSAANDFNIYLVNAGNTATLLASSHTDNVFSGIPSEDVYWYNNTGVAVNVAVEISKFAGPSSPSFLKYIARGNFGPFNITEYNTSSDAINPDAAAATGSIAVAAVAWNEPGLNDPESYSSRGLKTRLFDANGVRYAAPQVRRKPLVAAADCVLTSYTFTSNQPFGGAAYGFCGTSAATPSAAGIAALMKSARPALPPALMEKILSNAAYMNDCTLAGNPDTDCGFGFIHADQVVAAARDFPLHRSFIPITQK